MIQRQFISLYKIIGCPQSVQPIVHSNGKFAERVCHCLYHEGFVKIVDASSVTETYSDRKTGSLLV